LKKIFVFGSNEAGRHGKGSAREARLHHGAIYGQGAGPQGSSYAIPTKDRDLKVLPVETIKLYVDRFKEYATLHPELTFKVVPVGCGLAGYLPKDIAPLFKDSPSNVELPGEFRKVINNGQGSEHNTGGFFEDE